MKKQLRNLAFASGVALTMPVHAFVMSVDSFVIDANTLIGSEYTVNYLLENGATDPNGNTNGTGYDVSGTATFSLADFDTATDKISFDITLLNTSGGSGDVQIGWQKFAFGTSPDVTSVTFTDADDGEVLLATLAVSPEVNNAVGVELDVMTSTGPGAPKLLLQGEWDTFKLDLFFSDLTGLGVEFDPFSAKFQSGQGSFEFGTVPPEEVAEPASIALFGLGLAGLGMARRRSKSQ